MRLSRLLSLRSDDIAMDVGTTNTVAYVRKQGIVLNEPSVVAVETQNGFRRVCAIGDAAKPMLGKTPKGVQTIRAIRNGVIADFDVAEGMVNHFVEKISGGRNQFRLPPKNMIMSVPSSATMVERRAIHRAAINAGAQNVWLIEEAIAAALGAGLPVTQPTGTLIVDIGAGATQVALLASGKILYKKSVRVGGDRIDDAIASGIRRGHNYLVGEMTAERIKIEIGAAVPPVDAYGKTMRVRELDIVRGTPAEIEVTEAAIAFYINEEIKNITEAVISALEQVPPELVSDIFDKGIVLTGGGSLLSYLDQMLAEETGLSVIVAENALTCVASGAGLLLEKPVFVQKSSEPEAPRRMQVRCERSVRYQTRSYIVLLSRGDSPPRPAYATRDLT
ncbi:rod shape-determining protein [Sphingomonas sp. BAUL-RG-20F-R05-02]|uniref:rod shape-determining protein n=1 Tax=Sphingomonas sp. BAUL-RG-20F-R05-02 TaxID=2914830 RepID=UPI001F55E983|nr:rod shape-determining protein [Sphingomonas sp. BAUL-RG-20F-R05-02]